LELKDPDKLKRRVLIVDDNEDFLILLGKVISRKCSCDVALTTSGYSALEKISSWQPTVVLTDIMMPDLMDLNFVNG